MAQPQGAGLCPTGGLLTHSPGPARHEAAHRPPHPAHHGSAHTAQSGQRLATRGPLRLQHRPSPVHGTAAAPTEKAQLRLHLRRPQGLRPAPHGALHVILRHLSMLPEVIDLLLFLHMCARLRIVTAHGLTQPVHMLHGVWQGNPESLHLYALFREPLLRVQGHRLRPPGEAERGLIQAYTDDLFLVADTLQHFVEGVEAVAVYLEMMGMELNPCKCGMATTKGVPGLQLRLCPQLENPWHWVPAADSVPYL